MTCGNDAAPTLGAAREPLTLLSHSFAIGRSAGQWCELPEPLGPHTGPERTRAVVNGHTGWKRDDIWSAADFFNILALGRDVSTEIGRQET
jgi:hypothetical protein